MMLVISLITLVVASAFVFLSSKIQDEVFKVAVAVVAGLCLLAALFFAPWVLKLTMASIPVVIERIHKLSLESLSR